MKTNAASRKRQSGFNLLEVLIGIVIFALGMMALAQLQGNLTKSSSDANLRTVAINIAEGAFESLRSFSRITPDPDGVKLAYDDITDGVSYPVDRGGVTYTLTRTVEDYYYHSDAQMFRDYAPTGVALSDMKLVTLNVQWDNNQQFQIDESNTTTGKLGSGSVTLSEIVSKHVKAGSGKVLVADDNELFAPPVDYNPGSNPDIISITLGANKFKESTTPLPDVYRTNELVETRFDVVTYSQNDAGATFLRREEFIAVSCECTLRQPPASADDGGRRPTIWAGSEYAEGQLVAKAYGVPVNSVQSQFCGLCCRDHHDGGTGSEDLVGDPGKSRYDPFRDGADYHSSGVFSGDHKHYNRNNQGVIQLAESDGNRYLEACRLIRKDGFFRVAQDLRQEGLNSFPGDYLDQDGEVLTYSNYVTGAVTAYETAIGAANLYENNPPTLTEPVAAAPPFIIPASRIDIPTQLPTTLGNTSQQLRNRGIYIDYLSDDLRVIINCLDLGGSPESCGVPEVSSALEVIPFFDVQLTWLARWNETPNNNPVDVSNEAVEDNNTHSRGDAQLESGVGFSTVNAAVHTGNLGLTATDPIDPFYSYSLEDYNLYVLAISESAPPGLDDILISGTITSAVAGVRASDVEISASEAQCDRTNTGYECLIEIGANNPKLTAFNYDKPNQDLVACSAVLDIHGQEVSTNSWTRFNLPEVARTDANIVIMADSCSLSP
jgi:prepilin-type N-terminal cleavage/methylation domain-containing protein